MGAKASCCSERREGPLSRWVHNVREGRAKDDVTSTPGKGAAFSSEERLGSKILAQFCFSGE